MTGREEKEDAISSWVSPVKEWEVWGAQQLNELGRAVEERKEGGLNTTRSRDRAKDQTGFKNSCLSKPQTVGNSA